MRFPILYGVRPLVDHKVDRPDVEVQQCMQLTGTNRPRAWSKQRTLVYWIWFLCSCEGTYLIQFKISGGNGWEATPVPIPNTEVKLPHADNTWLVTAREDRSLPDSIYSSIAQLAEHAAVNRGVVGSSPTGGAISKLITLWWVLFFCIRRL